MCKRQGLDGASTNSGGKPIVMCLLSGKLIPQLDMWYCCHLPSHVATTIHVLL